MKHHDWQLRLSCGWGGRGCVGANPILQHCCSINTAQTDNKSKMAVFQISSFDTVEGTAETLSFLYNVWHYTVPAVLMCRSFVSYRAAAQR